MFQPSGGPINGTESGEALFFEYTQSETLQPASSPSATRVEWYAVQTRSRHERVVAQGLQSAGIETFLPLYSDVRSWTDRQKIVEFPLFPGYLFARTAWSNPVRVRVLQTNGAVGFVGPRKEATPIPTQQIEAVRSLLSERTECRIHPYLAVGQRVRIRSGVLKGLEGILVRAANSHDLVVSIDLIHRSLAMRIDGYEVEGL
jgi:transcriptional antiterminator NusG